MPRGVFTFELRNRDGSLVWRRRVPNLWVTEGKNAILDGYFGGSALAAVYVGLVSSVGFTALTSGDTAAQINGTNGWKEAGLTSAPTFSEVARQTLTLAAASAGSRVASAAVVWNITSAGTIKGAFLSTSPTLDGTAGKLLAVGLQNEGDQVVANGQTFGATYQVVL